MSPDRLKRDQRGAGLPVALFIITVLALLVLGMSQLQQSSGFSVSLQIQSQRAFYAAESGAQIAVRNVLEAASCGAVPGSIDFGVGALASCDALLACEAVSADVGTGGDTAYTITSTGQCGAGSAFSASRVLEVKVR